MAQINIKKYPNLRLGEKSAENNKLLIELIDNNNIHDTIKVEMISGSGAPEQPLPENIIYKDSDTGDLYVNVNEVNVCYKKGVLNKYDGDGTPTVNDDETAGYSQGSIWFDVTSDPKSVYICQNPTEGEADWIKTALSPDEAVALVKADSDVSDALAKRHAKNQDTKLDEGGSYEVNATEIKDAVNKAHAQNTDTKLAEGTGHEVTAQELRSVVDAPAFSGKFDDLTGKPVSIPSLLAPVKLRTSALDEFWADEHVWAMNVHEGRFSASYNGNVTKMWIFPAGSTDTVSGSPIRTSLADTVDVQIPADGGTVYLAVEVWDSNPAVVFEIIEAHGTPGNKVDMFYKHLGELNLSASNSFKGAWPIPDGTYYMCEKMDLSGTAMTGTENATTLSNLATYWSGKTVTGGIITLNDNATGLEAQTDIDTLTTAGFTVSAMLLPVSEPVGSGTEADPYLISTMEELTWITVQVAGGNQFINKYFKQTANIDASDTQTWNGGWLPIGDNTNSFNGNYDGDGYTIDGIYKNDELFSGGAAGLFGYFSGAGSAYLKNINLTNVYIKTNGYVGGIAGKCSYDKVISNCSVQGTLIALTESDYIGGIVGVYDGIYTVVSLTIDRCYVNATLGSSAIGNIQRIGGIVGSQIGSLTKGVVRLTECRFDGDIYLTYLSSLAIGCGLITSCASDSYIKRCVNNGIFHILNSDQRFSGITATNISIENCYNNVNILNLGNTYGITINGTITNCYNRGTAYYGISSEGTVTASYYDSAKCTAGTGTGKTASELQQQSTYDGWDFTTIWAIDPLKNDGYPYLRWEETEGLIE